MTARTVTPQDPTCPERDRGASTVLAVAIIATMLSVIIALTPLFLSLIERNRLTGAADAAALAAADIAVGREPGVPCEKAREVAAANDAHVTTCIVDGVIVTVRVASRHPSTGVPFHLDATATAGPPGAR